MTSLALHRLLVCSSSAGRALTTRRADVMRGPLPPFACACDFITVSQPADDRAFDRCLLTSRRLESRAGVCVAGGDGVSERESVDRRGFIRPTFSLGRLCVVLRFLCTSHPVARHCSDVTVESGVGAALGVSSCRLKSFAWKVQRSLASL